MERFFWTMCSLKVSVCERVYSWGQADEVVTCREAC